MERLHEVKPVAIVNAGPPTKEEEALKHFLKASEFGYEPRYNLEQGLKKPLSGLWWSDATGVEIPFQKD